VALCTDTRFEVFTVVKIQVDRAGPCKTLISCYSATRSHGPKELDLYLPVVKELRSFCSHGD